MTLHIDTGQALGLETSGVIGQSIAVLGVTGSGKSNTVGVLAEELLSQGLPMTFVDPEGEMWGLKERFSALVVGRSEQAELDVGPDHAAELAQLSVERGLSIILDLSEHSQEEQDALLLPYLEALWNAARRAQRPYVVAVEEAHEFLPQGGRSPLKTILTRMALRGRKRGLSLILSSQRSAKVDKDVLTQTSLLFLHRVLHPIDLDVYKALIPLEPKEVERQVRALEQGQAIALVKHLIQTVSIRRRETFHPSSTPTMEPAAQPALQAVDSALLAELQTLLATPNPAFIAKDERSKLQAHIRRLEEENKKQATELETLRQELATRNHHTIETTAPTLPTHLEIAHATVGRVTLPGRVVEAAPTALIAPTPREVLDAPATTPNSQEQRQLTQLTGRLKRLPSLHKRVLSLLANHEEQWLRPDTIATWLYLQEKTITSNPPLPLVKMGLVQRRKMGHGFQYQSLLSAWLAQHLPRLDTERLKWQVLDGMGK